MIPKIGYFALFLALLLALGTGAAHLICPACRRGSLPAAGLLTALVAVAFASLMFAFISNDFSILAVVRHSSTTLPLPYRMAAVWAGHEGSMLLWTLLLCGWTLAVALRSSRLPAMLSGRLLGVLMFLIAAFLLFLLFASNPFERLFNVASEGRDLNPLLQNPAMILHPPLLFMGTAGLALPYAAAVAALLSGQFDQDLMRWLRPWLAVAWGFLTLGIALGSWWAYTELGWGGWWFWDPVENAALMPWLAAIALLHALTVSRPHGNFRHWTLLLALVPFSLALLGTFLVRSGILTSVHAFAADPGRGIFILILLALTIGGALLLYAKRAPTLAQWGIAQLWSREAPLLAGIMLLLVTCATVLLGTLYPLLVQALGLGRISVGPPYFNLMFALLMSPALLLMVTTPFIRSKEVSYSQSKLAMLLAHLGVVLFALGAVFSGSGGAVRELKMAPGETATIAGYSFKLQGIQVAEGSNYAALRGRFEWSSDDKSGVLQPEKRRYRASPMLMTEAAIDSSLWRDLYVSLGEPVDCDQPFGAWTVRLQIKPMMNWLWAGALLMALGGFATLLNRQKEESS
ncbi:MAG: Cytochrome c-type biosis protein CcmF [Proteobacteria bacterium]|nr:Cytochrome c-type biosis protein CcmF [Pseudomonadota bacterium]